MGRFVSNGVDHAVFYGDGSAGGLRIRGAEEQLEGEWCRYVGAQERLGGSCRGAGTSNIGGF